jgi:ABC-type transport system involved in multi-copper enzyme maturation permease subunit
MIWLTLRQFRVQALTALAILAAAAIYLLITGVQMRHTYTADLAACTPLNNCDDALRQFQDSYYRDALNLNQLFVIVAPALIGMFWGAPLVGRELETGTHQLAWNQSVTRTRWLAVKLTVVGLASIATAAVLSYLLTWWAGPLDQINGDRFGAMTFASRDIVPLGYAAFALALGTIAGLILRRTLPAMAITLAVFIGIQILLPTLIRPNLLPSTTLSIPINQTTTSQAHGIHGNNGGYHFDGLPVPLGAWIISDPGVEDSSGQVAQMSSHITCFPGPGAFKAGGNPIQQIGTCLAPYDLHESVTYQPASHYWPLQWIETGIFLALSAMLSGFCFLWIRRRQN